MMRQIIANKFNIAHLQMMYQMDHSPKDQAENNFPFLKPMNRG